MLPRFLLDCLISRVLKKLILTIFFFSPVFHCFYGGEDLQRSLLCLFPHLVLICISIMTNNIEHLFMCLCAILIFFDEMSAQICFHFLQIRLCVFLLMSSENVLCILYTNSLSDICLADIFFQSAEYIFNFCNGIFQKQLHFLDESTFINFSLLWFMFCVLSKKSFLNPRSQDFILEGL